MNPATPSLAPEGLITHDNVWQFGILGIVCVGLVVALVVMWRHNVKRDDQRAAEREAMAKERNEWALERETRRLDNDRARADLRIEFESKHRDLAERFGKDLADLAKSARENADEIRREFADTLEAMADAQERGGDKQIAMIEKLTDRIVIAAKPRGGY